MSPENGSVSTNSEGVESLKILWQKKWIEKIGDYRNSTYFDIFDESGNIIRTDVMIDNNLMTVRFHEKLLNDKFELKMDSNFEFLEGIVLEHRKRTDLNNDNQVGMLDFAGFASDWLWTSSPDVNLVGYWEFQNNANDSSIYSNDGVNYGSVIDGVAYFDNTDYFEVSDSNSLTFNNQVSLSVWVKIDNFVEGWPKVIIKPYYTTSNPWELFCIDLDHHGDCPRFVVTEGVPNGVIEVVKDVNTTLNADQWYHIAGVYDGQEARLYVDGQLVASEQVGITFTNNDVPLSIGSRLGTNCFNGYIDEVKIFNRGLTEQEIESLSSCR